MRAAARMWPAAATGGHTGSPRRPRRPSKPLRLTTLAIVARARSSDEAGARDVAHLHGDSTRLTRETALNERGEVVNGGGDNPTSWNSAPVSRGCSQEGLISTGGAGLFYCFAT